MIPQLKNVIHIKDYVLEVEFSDGLKGKIDLSKHLKFEGIFKELSKSENFKKFFINPDNHVLTWPNGADFDPIVLYSLITGNDIKVS